MNFETWSLPSFGEGKLQALLFKHAGAGRAGVFVDA
jgi:hypothetical protein